MNNRDIVNTIGFMIMILIIVIMYFFRYSSNTIPENISGKEWYHYNYKTGFFDKFNIKNNELVYYKPSNINELNEYDICKKYTYDKKNNQLNFDCGKSFKILSYDEKTVNIKINDEEITYFLNYEESINHEFEKYFEKSLIEYKKEKEQAKELIEINEQKLYEVIKSDEYSKIVFIGDKCTSIDCVLALNVLEKWINKTENVYFFNANNLNDKLLINLNKINKSFEKNYDSYNSIYPKVIITNNSNIIDKYDINCDGFKCNKFFDNEF